MGRRELVAGILVLVFAAFSTAVMADDAMDFLRKWDVKLKPNEGALMGTLVTIVPSSGRLIVKTGADQKTVVLALSSGFKVMEGKMAVDPSSLERGQTVVLVLDTGSKEVKFVYKYF
ncbi:MAG: hypothetical protein Kow00109_28720 [Acidobacteriota bacterium]